MPWLDAERPSPFAPGVYAFSLFALYAPNVILVSCVLFAIATASRSLPSPTAAWWGSWWRTTWRGRCDRRLQRAGGDDD